MTIARLVHELEKGSWDLTHLCGEILATLEMPRNRVSLENGEGVDVLYEHVARWRASFDRIRGDSPNLPFTPAAPQGAEGE